MKIAGMKTLLFGVMALLYAVSAEAATTLLPNGKQCFSATTGINGMVGLLGTITGGSGYVNGVYGNVALTGGSGSGATANITVSGGAVTSVLMQLPGINYVVGNPLSAATANIGGSGSGFSVSVASIAVNASMAGGQVNMFVPSTTTVKSTWQDSGQVALNTNPIILDSNGCAAIYGTGVYRQQLLDSLGNLIWDQLTTDTSAFNSVFWAGLAGGTPNVVTVVNSGFNGTDGSVIQFIPLSTNTGATTLNPSGFGNIPVVKDSGTGSIALVGGEFIPGNVVWVTYSATGNSFHVLNLINPTNPTTAQTLCGAIGLKITNDGVTPNSKMTITADQITMINTGGSTISRTNVSFTLNFTVNGVNGLDTGTFVASTWYNIWVIDNGSGGASLGSLSTLSPTMPGGYAYKCRLGAVQTDSAGNLFRTQQQGAWTAYTVVAGITNNITYQLLASGVGGTITSCIVAITWVTKPLTVFVPPTATQVSGFTVNEIGGGGPNFVAVAATNTEGTNNTNLPALCSTNVTFGESRPFVFELQSYNLFYGGAGAGSGAYITGWKDKVNAN